MTQPKYLLAALAILLLTILGYSGLWAADFVYEDGNATGFAAVAPMPIAPLRVRALTRASYRLDRWLGGGGPRSYHLTNLSLHLLNGGLVAALASVWISPVGALLAMLIFLWHPLQTEAVSYIAGRTEVLSTFFVLLACLIAVRGESRRSILNGILIVGCLILAMSAKESAICGVGLVGLCLSFQEGWATPLRILRRYWILAILLGGAVLGLCATVYWYEYHPIGHSPLGRWHYAALQATALWRYLLMIPFPFGQTVDHDFEILPLWVQGVALFGLIWGYALTWVLWVLSIYSPQIHQRFSLITFATNWIILSVILRFLMRIPETLNEHQVYLMFAGAAIGIASVADSFSYSFAYAPVEAVPSQAYPSGTVTGPVLDFDSIW